MKDVYMTSENGVSDTTSTHIYTQQVRPNVGKNLSLNQPLVLVRPLTTSSGRYWPTRVFDIVVAVSVLLFALPILLLVAVLVWRSSPGPIVYRQVRCGQNGRHFVLYKFRTMVEGAESLLANDPWHRSQYAQQWKLLEDPRVTWIGKWLRKSSIDELPQLLNVLRGDMSIVGPRPVRPDELNICYGEYADVVFSIKPGVTGLWQVNGRSNVTYEERIAMDMEYLRRRSFWFDGALLLRTIPAVLLMRGAV